MNPILRNILAVLAGIVVGSIVNMALVYLGHAIIPPPMEIDFENPDSFSSAAEMFTAKDYVFPFIAHAMGTLMGAYVTSKIAVGRKMAVAMIIGVWFLIGGIMAASMIGFPLIPSLIDLLFAYIPTAYIGGVWGAKSRA